MSAVYVRIMGLGFVVCSLGPVGCVPYQTYQQTKEELEKAKDTNADLVKKYNQALLKLKTLENGGGGQNMQGMLAQLEKLQLENAELKKHPNVPLPFTREQREVVGAEEEDGGMRFNEVLLFNEGSASLKPEGLRTLDKVITIFKTDYPEEKAVIEGHTDNQPLIKTQKLWGGYNMNLGYARARAVFEYFAQHGIPESRMIIHSYSYNKPIDPKAVNTNEGRRENRRVVVRRGGTQI